MKVERSDLILAWGTVAGMAGLAASPAPWVALCFLSAVCLTLYSLHLYAEAHGTTAQEPPE